MAEWRTNIYIQGNAVGGNGHNRNGDNIYIHGADVTGEGRSWRTKQILIN